MDLTTFEELTGIDVPDNQQSIVVAQIKRTQRIIEALLGYTLDSDKITNLHNEQGKTKTNCFCPNIDLDNLDDLDLDEPDAVIGAYRLFSYNPKDKYFHVDPFSQINAVKLVWNNITIRTFDADDYRANFNGCWGKYIENCDDNLCICSCKDCVQLAVDADWLVPEIDSSVDDSSFGCLSDELMYVWADMVAYYSDCKKDVKSETMLTHSYSKFDRKLPEEQSYNLAILKKFAGPHGTLTKVITP